MSCGRSRDYRARAGTKSIAEIRGRCRRYGASGAYWSVVRRRRARLDDGSDSLVPCHRCPHAGAPRARSPPITVDARYRVVSAPDCVDAANVIAEFATAPTNATYMRVQHIGDPGSAELAGEIAGVVTWNVGALSGFGVPAAFLRQRAARLPRRRAARSRKRVPAGVRRRRLRDEFAALLAHRSADARRAERQRGARSRSARRRVRQRHLRPDDRGPRQRPVGAVRFAPRHRRNGRRSASSTTPATRQPASRSRTRSPCSTTGHPASTARAPRR